MYKTKEYTKRRYSDNQKEKLLMPYFDYVYNHNGCTLFSRNNNQGLQKRGVDVFIYSKQRKILLVDEKCATNYWRGNLKTFAFEIWTTNNVQNNGWFNPHNDFYLTTDYNIAWVTASDKDLSKIYSLECMMISKETMWSYIESIGFTYDKLMKAFSENAQKHIQNERVSLRYQVAPDIQMVQSLHMIESPINLVISKKLLKEMSYSHTINKFPDGVIC